MTDMIWTDTVCNMAIMHAHRIHQHQLIPGWPVDGPHDEPVHTLNYVLPEVVRLAEDALCAVLLDQLHPGVSTCASEEVRMLLAPSCVDLGIHLVLVDQHARRG